MSPGDIVDTVIKQLDRIELILTAQETRIDRLDRIMMDLYNKQ